MMKTIVDESILANPHEKEMIEQATKILEDELEDTARLVQAEWRRIPDSGDPPVFELKLLAWGASKIDRYESQAFVDSELLQRRFRRQMMDVVKQGMKILGRRLEANLAEAKAN